MWCIKGSLDTDVVYNIGNLTPEGELATNDFKGDKTYYTAWGYDGDSWGGRQIGTNLLPTM